MFLDLRERGNHSDRTIPNWVSTGVGGSRTLGGIGHIMSVSDQPNSSREAQEQPTPQLAAVLERVDAIRGNRDWAHSTPPPSKREERRNRLLRARLGIAERIASYVEAVRSPVRDQSAHRVWIAVPTVVFCWILVWMVISRHWTEQSFEQQFSFKVSGTAPFLSQQLALAKARQALSQVVRDPSALTPVLFQDQSRTTASGERRTLCLIREGDNAGTLFFQSNGKVWDVTVQLRGDAVQCTVRGTESRWSW